MTVGHAVTAAGLVGNLVGFAIYYKASAAEARPGADPARLRSMNHIAFVLVAGGFALQFLGAGIFLPK